jgi:16S rRNA (cytosine967-C5)-methyltransferase
LIYATCSLEQVEGEEQVSTFLDRHAGWIIDPARAGELPEAITTGDQGMIRTLPAMLADAGGLDGFFVARLRAPSD